MIEQRGKEGQTQSRKKVERITTGIHPDEYKNTRMVDLLDWTTCYVELVKKIHPHGITCGRCGSGGRVGHGSTRRGYPRSRCTACGFVYSILSGTPFSGVHLGAKELVLFMRMWADKRPAHEIAQAVGATRDAVSLLQKNLILHKKHNRAGAE